MGKRGEGVTKRAEVIRSARENKIEGEIARDVKAGKPRNPSLRTARHPGRQQEALCDVCPGNCV